MTTERAADLDALVAAAEAFAKELAAYRRAGELFVKAPLDSVKHIERANTSLAEIAACEERLQAAAQALVGVLGAARAEQEALAAEIVAHVPALRDRNAGLGALMKELADVAAAVGDLNVVLASGAAGGEGARSPKDVAAAVLALSERARQLAARAHDVNLEEVATQAHALHQKLSVIAKKLDAATR